MRICSRGRSKMSYSAWMSSMSRVARRSSTVYSSVYRITRSPAVLKSRWKAMFRLRNSQVIISTMQRIMESKMHENSSDSGNYHLFFRFKSIDSLTISRQIKWWRSILNLNSQKPWISTRYCQRRPIWVNPKSTSHNDHPLENQETPITSIRFWFIGVPWVPAITSPSLSPPWTVNGSNLTIA